ncbi:MAG TPA: MBL fold metallo-hydrolase [Alphaproteobacteria bacterium]|nr:MBL fold metallo-hydrolase [Alphaproteobacteria bacterium]
MKAICGAFLAALLVIGPTPALADITLRPQSVTAHVHVISWPAAGEDRARNSTVIEQSDGLAVVDPAPTARDGRLLIGAIRKLSGKPVKYLVYTHGQGHDPAARLILKAWPHLTVVATDTARDEASGTAMDYIQACAHDYAGTVALAREQLKRADLLPEMRSDWQRLIDAGKSVVSGYSEMSAYLATLTFSDRLDLPDPETPLEVLYLERVNGNGGAVVWAPTEKTLYTGDVAERLPRTVSDPLARLRLLDRIAAYDFAYLIPGRGDIETDRAYLDKTKASLARVMDEVEPLARTGSALADAYQQGDLKSLMAAFSGNGARRKAG